MRESILNNRAFTLMEILVVVILLAIIASVVIPLCRDSQDSARLARAKTDIYVLNRQIELYKANGQNFPSDVVTYTQAATVLSDASYIKFVMQAPDGFQYSFDASLREFSYIEPGE